VNNSQVFITVLLSLLGVIGIGDSPTSPWKRNFNADGQREPEKLGGSL